jgi:peptide deformylase
VQLLIERMRATMRAAPGVGLAAPQVGEGVQLAVIEDGPNRWGHLSERERVEREREELPFTVLVNPVYEVIEHETVSFYEGCLSVPGLTGVVARHRVIRVSALDEHGDAVQQVFSGWPARIVQHEIDHLAGILYLDKVQTRSISTVENFARIWQGRTVGEVARGLGFDSG